jgi:transcriptional regulator with XRE-family HTH domain
VPNPNLSLSFPPQVLRGDFAGWLEQAMARRRMSQRMLALRSGLNHATISRLLTSTRDPSLSTALALIRTLEGPILQLAPPAIEDDLSQDMAS